jgi:hypothetical protein
MPNDASPIEQASNTWQTFGTGKATCRMNLLNLAADSGSDCGRALFRGHTPKPNGCAPRLDNFVAGEAESQDADAPTLEKPFPGSGLRRPIYRALCQLPTAV